MKSTIDFSFTKLFLFLFLFLFFFKLDAQTIFWAEYFDGQPSLIKSKDLATGEEATLYESPALFAVSSIAVDELNQRIFFSEYNFFGFPFQERRLAVMDYDGSNIVTVENDVQANAITYDELSDQLYFLDVVSNAIISRDGDGVSTTLAPCEDCKDLVFDRDDHLLHFMQGDIIRRVSASGGTPETLAFMPELEDFATRDFTYNPVTNDFFIIDYLFSPLLRKVNFDGSIIETLYDPENSNPEEEDSQIPYAAIPNTTDGKLYYFWTQLDPDSGTYPTLLRRSNFDGSNLQNVAGGFPDWASTLGITNWDLDETPSETSSDFNIKHFSIFRDEPLASAESDELQTSPFQLCVDGAQASFFDITPSNPENVNLENLSLRISLDPGNLNPDKFGTFSYDFTFGNTKRFKFTHPVEMEGVNDLLSHFILEIYDTDSEIVYGSFDIHFYHPPVLMVHGLWSNGEAAFSKMKEELQNSVYYSDFMLKYVDYSTTNDASFSVNDGNETILKGIRELVAELIERKISVQKVDVVGHSMGGILTRIYIHDEFYRDNVRKLITCNTPHFGSHLANLLNDVNFICISAFFCEFVESNEMGGNLNSSCYNGAVSDLQVNNPAIFNLNSNNTAGVYLHALVTTETASNLLATTANDPMFVVIKNTLYTLSALASVTVDEAIENIFNEPNHDLIVSESSQKGGFDGELVSTIPGQMHGGATANIEVINEVRNLLTANPKSDLFTIEGYNTEANDLSYQPTDFCDNNSSSGSVALTFPPTAYQTNIESSIQFQIAGSAEINRIELVIEEEDEDGFHVEIVENSSMNFTYVPSNLPLGKRLVTVTGFNEENIPVQLINSYIILDTEQVPISIYPVDSGVSVGKDNNTRVYFKAQYPDFETSLSSLQGVGYNLNTLNASWVDQNIIKGEALGYDTLTVSYKGIESSPLRINVFDPDDFDITSTYEPATSRNQPESIKITNIYPNPVKEEFTLEFLSTDNQWINIRISDIHGKTVYSSTIQVSKGENITNLTLDDHAISNGIFFVSLISKLSVQTEKIVKQ